MRKILLWALFVYTFLPVFTQAQSNYRSGYFLKNNGDTVKGFINYQQWNRSPRSIQFKQINDNQSTEYKAQDLKSFSVTGFESYLSYIGPVSTGKVVGMDLTELSNGLDTGKRRDTAFLKVLSTGPNVTLLYHADNIKRRYFIMERGAKPVELNYYVYINNGSIINVYEYRDQLKVLLQKYVPEDINTQNKLKQAYYDTNDLIKFIRIINKNIDDTKTKSSSGTRFFAGAGASYNMTSFSGPDNLAFSKNSSSVSPIITFGFDFLDNYYLQKTFFRLEALFTEKTPTFTSTVGYYTLHHYSAALSPQYFLSLYNSDKVKFFAGGGIGLVFNFASDAKLVATDDGRILTPFAIQNKGDSYKSLKEGEYIKNPYPLLAFSGYLNLKTGIIINKKIEVYLSGIPLTFSDTNTQFSYLSNRVVFGFNYLIRSAKK